MNPCKIFVLAILIAMGTSACESDDETTLDPNNIIGTWVNQLKDGKEVPTDDRFVTTYRSNLTELYAIRGKANHWTETDNYAYAFNNGIITIASGNTRLEYTTLELTESKLVYQVSKLIIGGVNLEDVSTYTLRKVTTDYSAQLLGLWEGHETTDGLSGPTHRWKYNANGSYQYYHTQVGGQWQNKADNSGQYFLYGDYFVSNYKNDANSGVVGNVCEAWDIEIKGNTMSWKALRNNKTYTFTMNRVTE